MKPLRFFGAGVALCTAGLALSCSSKDTTTGGNTSPPTTNVVTMEDFGMPRTGVATFYTTADGSGACLYDKNTSDTHIAALVISDCAGSACCQAWIDVTSAMGTVRVRIVDECPDCMPGQLDLHPGAF